MRAVFFGDSITAGQGVSAHLSFVSLVAARMHPEWMVINAGLPGDTTHTALDRMTRDALKPRPDLLVLQFGANDMNRWQTEQPDWAAWGRPTNTKCIPRVSLGSFTENLREMYSRSMHWGIASTVFLSVGEHYPPPGEIPTVHVPLWDIDLLDDVHLSVRGNEKVANLLASYMKGLKWTSS